MDSEFWRYVENAKCVCSFPAAVYECLLPEMDTSLQTVANHWLSVATPGSLRHCAAFLWGNRRKSWENQTDMTKIVIKTICSYYGGRDL